MTFFLFAQMMSAVHKFRAAPLTDPDASFSFVVYGDMGVSAVPGAHDTAKYMIEEANNGSSFVFHVGDISYARGYVSTFHGPILFSAWCPADER